MKRQLSSRLEDVETRLMPVAPRPIDERRLLAESFPEQLAFVKDESDLLAGFCTRRAAKSYSGGLKAFRVADRHPKCSVLIAGLHRDEVKRIWWQPILKAIDERAGIGAHFNESELSCRLRNGAMIYLLGMDADEKQKRKALGQKYPLVVIDEAQDWHTDLNELVFHVLKPAVADYNGAIALLGTPGLVSKGLFFDITTGKEPGWKLHAWDTYKNTTREKPGGLMMSEKWDLEIRKLKAMKPGVEKTPWFRRNYLREWVIDTDALVYRYAEGRNDFQDLPTYRTGEWVYVLGCDLGYADATSFTICAYHEHDNTMYVMESQKESGLDITAASQRTKALARKYDVSAYVVDGANKQAVEEMKKRHDIPWKAADKTGKADFIELMNAEFIVGSIKLRKGYCQPLATEYANLIWDQKVLKDSGKREEHAGCENHCADATLYAWRYCLPYLSEAEPETGPKAGSVEWQQAQSERQAKEVEEQMERDLDEQTRAWAEKNTWENAEDWL